MANDLTIIDAEKEFAAIAADRMKAAADMSLHELVDEFVRLTAVVKDNLVSPENDDDDDYSHRPRLTAAGMIADGERRLINAAARARFSLHLSEGKVIHPYSGD